MSGLIASGHHLATKAGELMFEKGGNAFDAAIACAFTQTVVEPLLASLGGGGYMIAGNSQSSFKVYDFFVDFPGRGRGLYSKSQEIVVDFLGADQKFKIGKGTITVPGTLEGLLYCHKKLGTLCLTQILQPAIEYAQKGHTLNRTQADVISFLKDTCAYSEEGKKLFFSDISKDKRQKTKSEGQLYQNKKLGLFLKKIAHQEHHGFRDKTLVEQICKDIQNETHLNPKDFYDYKVMERNPLEWSYRDYHFYSTPPPALGGELIQKLLHELESKDISHLKWGSFEHLLIWAQTLKKMESTLEESVFKKGTTHLSTCDDQGNMASLSLSNGEGSGYFAPHTGIMLNNMVGEEDIVGNNLSQWKPGQRMPSRISPIIMRNSQNKHSLLGTGGSRRIRSSLFTVISNLVDFKMNLKQAVYAPRMNWDDRFLQLEPGFPQESINQLKKHMPVNEWNRLGFFFGGIHSVSENQEAVGDPRREGTP